MSSNMFEINMYVLKRCNLLNGWNPLRPLFQKADQLLRSALSLNLNKGGKAFCSLRLSETNALSVFSIFPFLRNISCRRTTVFHLEQFFSHRFAEVVCFNSRDVLWEPLPLASTRVEACGPLVALRALYHPDTFA
jgi:hypothetical protein